MASSSSPSPRPTLLTFLIADVRGYTRFTAEQGDEAAARLADRFATLCEEVLGQHDGQVLELRGDEAVAVFSSARHALRGAVALQDACNQAIDDDPSLPLTVGMGLDAGEPIPVRGGYRGGALNLAARLCSIAGGGEILASEGVIHLARRTEGLVFVDRGPVTLKGLAAPVRVLQIAAEGELPEELLPLQPILVTHPTNLPDDPTPFIGREGDIAAIVALLRDPPIRLITLTGPAGTGKTRLALQVAGTLLYDFEDDVFVCDLSTLTDPALVPSALAQALSIEETGGDLVERLVDRVGEKHLLLVLDTFEHLLDGCEVVAKLLDGCRHLHILVTSQIPLHLSREHEYAVPPLSVPDPRRVRGADNLSRYESVALFIQRARAVKESFMLTDENAAVVAEICARLDGLPLAIELAAARIKLFPPPALLQRLDSRLTLLKGGARDRPTRQQTLQGAIDWSHSLLAEEEQVLFARLSVFAGGWTFQAAEAVCNEDGALDVLDGLASLVDKSLVRQEGEDEPRFSMLETIREYAGAKLAGPGEKEEIRAAHAGHFLGLAADINRHLQGPDQVRWLDRLERDHDNLRAVLRRAIARGDAEIGMHFAVNLSRFWYWRGYFSESLALCNDLLALPTPPDARALRAELLEAMAIVPLRQGDYGRARALLDEGLALARGVDDPGLLALTLCTLGWTARLQDDYAVAQSALEEGLALARHMNDVSLIARCIHHLGLLALEGRNDLEAAWALNDESLTLYRESGNSRMVAVLLGTMGRVARARSDAARARELLVESVSMLQGIGDLGVIPQMLYALAGANADLGQVERAVRLQSAAMKMEEVTGGRVWPSHERERESWLGKSQATLGEASFVRAWAEGQLMTVDQMVAYALEEHETIESTGMTLQNGR